MTEPRLEATLDSSLQYSVPDSHLLPMKSGFIVSSLLCLSLHPSSPSHSGGLSENWILGFQPCGGTHVIPLKDRHPGRRQQTHSLDEQTCALQWVDTGVMSLAWEEERFRVSDDLRLDATVKRQKVHQNLNFPLSFI